MAKGRLRSTTINSYTAAEIYHNSSSDEASITIHGQVISETENSTISVAATATDFSSTILTVGVSTDTTGLSPYNCLLAVNSCNDSGNTYIGYSMNSGSDICLSAYNPSYVDTGGTAYCKGYAITQATCCSLSPCCYVACFEHYGLQYTMVHPKILAKCGKGRFIAANYKCTAAGIGTDGAIDSCLVLACYGCHTDEVALKLNSCLESVEGCFTNKDNAEIYATCGNCMPSAWYVDLWSCRTFVIGTRKREPAANINGMSGTCEYAFVLCGCPRTVTPGCVCLNEYCTPGCSQAGTFIQCNYTWSCLANKRDHYQKGPLWGGGCNIYFAHEQIGVADGGACAFYLKSIETLLTQNQNVMGASNCVITKICHTAGCLSGANSVGRATKVCVDRGEADAIYPIKWFAYNPMVKCHYFMIHNGGTDDGIYKIDNVTLGQCVCCDLEESAIYFCTTVATAPISKVADVPSAFTRFGATGQLCYGRLYQADFCYYSMPVNNGTEWTTMSTTDLVNWKNSRTNTTCCFVQLTQTNNVTYTSSGGSGICKVTNNYDCCIALSGTIDYKVEANQYQQNGVVLSSGDRLYAKNDCDVVVAYNVWGYEG